MKVLVIGRSGQLATELMRAPWPAATSAVALGRPALDVTDATALAAAVAAVAPDVVVNAAAYTAVDRAESESDQAFAVNAAGARHLAVAARERGIPLIHVSTDYVFDGRGSRPWREEDEPNPRGVYARSKLAGERAVAAAGASHVIVRTSWLFAAQGQNFVRAMLRLGAERDRLGVVVDQVGCPTAAADLAGAIAAIAVRLAAGGAASGIYHYAGSGPVSWYGFAQAIFAEAGDLVPRPPALEPISTAAYGAPAPRPAFSVLDCGKIERELGLRARSWRTGLRAAMDELKRSRPAASPPRQA